MPVEEILVGYDQEQREVRRGPRREILEFMKQASLAEGDAPFAVRSVMLMLTNNEGLLYVVKRGDDRAENPGLFDKSVGGHVAAGEEFSEALRREASEELSVDVLEVNPLAYPNSLRTTNLNQTAVVRLIDFQPWLPSLRKDQSGREWKKRFQAAIFAGRYDGPVAFSDREAAALALIRKPELSELLAAQPGEFADDLHTLLLRYHTFFR